MMNVNPASWTTRVTLGWVIATAQPVLALGEQGEIDTVPVDGVATAAAEPTEEARGPRNRQIEEIVVTAQKREENMQDVPVSVQAFSADALDAKGIESSEGLRQIVPSLQFSGFASYNIIYLRGMGTNAYIPSADPTVATYIDNVYYPNSGTVVSALFGVDRIEVLKGPQGTLFGRNSTGGAINIISKQPGPEYELSLQTSYERFDTSHNRAYVNVPLTDHFFVSVSGVYNEGAAYYELVDTPLPSILHDRTQGIGVKASWLPTEDTVLTVGYSYLQDQSGEANSGPATDVKPLGVAVGVVEQPPYKSSENTRFGIINQTKIVNADLQYKGSWLDVRLLPAYQHMYSPFGEVDFEGSNQPIASFNANHGQFMRSASADLQFLSNDDSWQSERFKWVVGLYYYRSKGGYKPGELVAGGDLFAALGDRSQELFSPFLAALGDRLAVLGILGTDGVRIPFEGVVETKSAAGYFQATWDLTEWMAVTGGARYTVETRALVESNSNVINPLTGERIQLFDFTQGNEPEGGKVRERNLSPKVVLDFKPYDDGLLYLSWSKGFKSGAFNIINLYTPSQYIVPEKATSYEIGLKSTFLDGTLRLNTALFQNNVTNLQVQVISLFTGGATRFENAGAARIRGADFDFVWEPLPEAVPGLVASGGGAFLSGKYTDYKNGSGYDEQTGLFFDRQRDFTGNKTVRTPRFSGNLGVSWAHELWRGSMEVAADYYYNSGSYHTSQNSETGHEHAYDTVGARISYLYDPWNLRATLFGTNLTSTKYDRNFQELDFASGRLLTEPRSIGLKLAWTY